MRIGTYISTRPGAALDALLERFEEVGRAGLHTAWLGQVVEHDALTALALAGRVTRRIELGTWVVPTHPRHPAALAQQALTVQAAAQRRLVLGIGVGHEAIVARRLGLDYSAPLGHMREYLGILTRLLSGEHVEHRGREFRVALRLDPFDTPPPSILLAALGPRMLELAGAAADGAAIWLGGPRYLETFAIPRVKRAARRAGRPPPRIVCGLPLAVTPAAGARASAEAFLARSSRLLSYRRVLEREGAASPADVAIIEDEAETQRRVAHLAELGVTDFHAVLFPVAGDDSAIERSLTLLGELARRGA